MNKLICPECRHENEVERIYCHECGTRLDRSKIKLGKEGPEQPQATQKRLRRMLGPRWSPMQHLFFKVAKLILAAVALAALVQMLLSPAPPERSQDLMLASQVTLDLENALLARRGGQLRYAEPEVNAFLLSALKNKQKALDKPGLKFERAFVGLEDGLLHFTVMRSVQGFPLSHSASYSPVSSEGKFAFAEKGGRLGRLNIHAKLMPYLGFLFADVQKALEREQAAVRKMADVRIESKAVVLTAPGP